MENLKEEIIKIYKSLEKTDARCDSDNTFDFFYSALSNECYNVCDLLLDNGFDINKVEHFHNRTILSFICDNCMDVKLAKWLIDHGADVNKHEALSILDYACYGGNEEIVKLVLDNGIEIKKNDPLHNEYFYGVVSNDNIKILKILFDYGIEISDLNIDHDINSILRDKKYDILEFLIQKGYPINRSMSINSRKSNLYEYAIKENDMELLQLLFKYNKDVDVALKSIDMIQNGFTEEVKVIKKKEFNFD